MGEKSCQKLETDDLEITICKKKGEEEKILFREPKGLSVLKVVTVSSTESPVIIWNPYLKKWTCEGGDMEDVLRWASHYGVKINERMFGSKEIHPKIMGMKEEEYVKNVSEYIIKKVKEAFPETTEFPKGFAIALAKCQWNGYVGGMLGGMLGEMAGTFSFSEE